MLSQFKHAVLPAALVLFAALGPLVLELFDLVNLSAFSAMAIAALGLAFVWGTLGILNLGHSVFFGLGAYAYAVATSNLGDSTPGVADRVLAGSRLLPVLQSSRRRLPRRDYAVRDTDLLFLRNIDSRSLLSHRLGPARRVQWHHGHTPLNMPADPQTPLSVEATFSICLLTLAGVYILLSCLRASNAGRIMAAIRESELRSELLGYDIRFYKLLGFAVSAAVAGLAGAFYTAVMGFVGPNVFDLPQASQFVLWVIAGGLGTFAGPTVASFGIQLLSSQLGANQIFNTELIFGATILLFVQLVPQGLLPMILSLADLKLPRRLSGLVRKEKPV